MIPEAAVEAAAQALSAQDMRDFHWDSYMPDARAALEAAAPHMLAQVWESGYRACDREWEQTADIVTPDEDRFVAKNPYRPAK